MHQKLDKISLKLLKVLGVELDQVENQKRGERLISTKDSKVKVFIIPTNEEVMIAREVHEIKVDHKTSDAGVFFRFKIIS